MMDMNQTLPADWFDDEQECRDDMQEMINIVCGTMPPLLSKLDFGLYTLAGSGRFAYGVCDTTIPFVLPEHEIEKMRDAFVSAFALTWGLEASFDAKLLKSDKIEQKSGDGGNRVVYLNHYIFVWSVIFGNDETDD